MSKHIENIRAERARQIEAEGYDAAHDDAHTDGSLLWVAVLYWLNATGQLSMRHDGKAPVGWPWHEKYWKPKTPREDLVRAGALCLAEKDRMKRLDRTFNHVDRKLSQIIATLKTLDKLEDLGNA